MGTRCPHCRQVMRPVPKAVRRIIDAASKLAGVDITGSHIRKIPIVRIRWAAYRACRLTGASYPTIAAAFGVDHSSVMYGEERAAADLAEMVSNIAEGRTAPPVGVKPAMTVTFPTAKATDAGIAWRNSFAPAPKGDVTAALMGDPEPGRVRL